MSEFTVVDDNNQIVEHFNADEKPPDPAGKPRRIVPKVRRPRPDIDGATQTVEPTERITAKQHVFDWVVADRPVAAAKAALVTKIKAVAQQKIIAIAPEWRQRNLLVQAAKLLKKGESSWTPDDTAAWNAGDVIWQQIAAIRAAGDVGEAAVNAATTTAAARTAYDAITWPA